VYAVGLPDPALEGHFLAAVKACEPDAWLSHYAAAARYGLVRWDGRRIDVTTPRPTRRAHHGIRVHRSTRLDRREVGWLGPIPITSPARTVIDLAAVLPFKALRRAVRQACSLGLVEMPELAKEMTRLGPRRGTGNLAKILSSGPVPTRSELEDVVLDLILAAGLPHPDVNRPITVGGRTMVPRFPLAGPQAGRGGGRRGLARPQARARGRHRAPGPARGPRRTGGPDELGAGGGAGGPDGGPPAASLRAVISTNQFKNGTHIEVDGTVFKILEFQHVKPGKGGAFVRTKLRRTQDGAVLDKTFRAGEKFRPIRTESRRMQFLYSDGTDAHFMDSETYDQMTIPEDQVKEPLRWVLPSQEVELLYVDERPTDVQVPSAVELTVSETEPGVKGDTASGGGDKPATLESGVTVRVPLFVNAGDKVRVDTRSGEYVSRA
jgi:elongation factor P